MLPVIYVAAGPGDPQLITLRGINAIKQAELIIADVNTMDIANAHANPIADVVAGRIERGIVKVNEEVEIVGIRPDAQKTIVTGVEMFRKLLDEPTNHLDVEGVAWLAKHLRKRRELAVVVITHDRWFLDEISDSIWEVIDGKVESYEGGYSAYVLAKAERAKGSACKSFCMMSSNY